MTEIVTNPLTEPAEAASHRPETFRLPKRGPDPYFGLSRSYYYEGEKLGYWRLLRLRKRGRLRGVTLVPFDDISAFLQKQNPGVVETPGAVGPELTTGALE